MTTRKQTAPADTDAPDSGPFDLDDAARAESQWLLARELDPDALPPSAEIASDYAEIEAMLRNLPLGPSEESWHDEVLRAAAASAVPAPRPWRRSTAARRMLMGSGGLAAAAVVLLMVWPRAAGAELEVTTLPAGTTRSGPEEVVVGDQLVVHARPRGAADLRVFRSDGTMVARCPGGPNCLTAAESDYSIKLTLDAPVPYHVILAVGATTTLPDATMDSFIAAATAANARVAPARTINVH